jgi:hypothetical protein
LAEVTRAFGAHQVDLQAKIKVRVDETLFDESGEAVTTQRIVDTTVGRALLWKTVPKGLPFDETTVNRNMTKKAISFCHISIWRKEMKREVGALCNETESHPDTAPATVNKSIWLDTTVLRHGKVTK